MVFVSTSRGPDQTFLDDSDQCDQIRQNFTKIRKSLQVFGKFLTVYFLFGKMLSLLWQFVTFWANFYCCNWSYIEKYANHLVTLILIHDFVLSTFLFSFERRPTIF